MVDAYHYVRFRWWTRVDLEKLSVEFANKFSIKTTGIPSVEQELTLWKDDRNELEVKADTITAFISSFRAVLFQKKPSPFTSRDVELRKKIIELYPRARPTPFPWGFGEEPKFEIANE